MPKKIINTTEKKPKRKSSLKLRIVLPLVIAGVLLAGGIVLWLYVQQRNQRASEVPATPSQVVEDAIDGGLEVGTEESKQKLEQALGDNPSDSEKMQLLQLLANEAQARNDFAGAVSYLKQAFEVRKDSHLLAQNVAVLYLEQLNDKPQALKYFKLAFSIPTNDDNNDPMREKNDMYVSEQIKKLEAEGVTAAE